MCARKLSGEFRARRVSKRKKREKEEQRKQMKRKTD
jgi:hypothetical protein